MGERKREAARRKKKRLKPNRRPRRRGIRRRGRRRRSGELKRQRKEQSLKKSKKRNERRKRRGAEEKKATSADADEEALDFEPEAATDDTLVMEVDPNTGVATTDLYGMCTKTHSGTSAAAPEAAGVFALAIEANRGLTWRDMQHLTVLTSKRNSLFDSKSRFFWNMNGVGLEFNHLFGFGVLDAGAMVALAKQWKTVPARFHCEAGSYNTVSRIPMDKSLFMTIDTNACSGLETEVNYLEHVQAVVTLNSTRRGAVQLFLRSPMGTRSMILSERPNDADSQDGFTKWPFMTTHTWAEYPRGRWSLEIEFVKEWTLLLHGTKEAPYTSLPVTDPHSKLAVVKK